MRARRARLIGTAVLAVLVVLSVLLPHVTIEGRAHGRWLIPSGIFFVDVQPGNLPSTSVELLAVAINVTYLGLAMQEFGLVLTVLTLWILATDDFNRWLYRMLVIGGWLLALSPLFVIVGWVLIERSGTPAQLGWAWLPTLLAGVGIIVGCRLSRDDIDTTWFVTRPELQ